jgi:hypothetical protein
MTMHMKHGIALLGVVALALGCHNKNADTTADENTSGAHRLADTGDPTDRSGSMIAPEKMDEIQRNLGRKQMIISHCLATAMENKEVARGARGKIALELVISGGKATSVKVIRSDIDSKTVQDCVVRHVQSISFPDVGSHYETSYTYAMEAN